MANIDQYWERRWGALDRELEFLSNSVDPARDPAFKYYSRFIGQLKDFANKQFHFFYHGFGGGQAAERKGWQTLETSLTHPPEHVLRKILDQAAYDFTIARLAVAQRLASSPEALETLTLAGRLATEYVALVQGRFIPGRVQVITYFQRGTSIRVIPYADVALIGVPPTAAVSEGWRELLAVGHEVGHFVYQNGFIDGERLPSVLSHLNRRRPAYIRRWQEEIFADVFGALVTGHPAVFFSARDMIADNSPPEAVVDDGVHPIDALRLHVYQAVSDWLGAIPAGTPDDFHGPFDYFVTSDMLGESKEVPLNQAATVLKEVAMEMCDFLHNDVRSDMKSAWKTALVRQLKAALGGGFFFGDPTGTAGTGAVRLATRRRDSYVGFATAARDLLRTDRAGAGGNVLGIFADLLAGPPRTRRWFETYRDRYTAQPDNGLPMPPAAWEVIYFADGWTGGDSHGPETNPPRGGWER